MKRICFILCFSLIYNLAFSQTDKMVSLQDCYKSAIENYPLLKQKALLSELKATKIQKLESQALPTVNWNTKATLQTETVDLPIEPNPAFPGIDLPLYNVKSYLEGQYIIYDGGILETKKALEEISFLANEQEITSELEKLKPQVNQLYFNILLLREKVNILQNGKARVENKMDRLEAGLKHGVVLQSDVDRLLVEAIKIEAGIEETQGHIKSLFRSLASLTGLPMDATTQLEVFDADEIALVQAVDRAELQLFDLKKTALLQNERLIEAANKPKLGAFLQAGIGYPNPLNFFEEQLSPYAIGGLNFSWKIFDGKQADKDRQLLAIQSRTFDIQKETFLKNLNVQEEKLLEDIETIKSLLKKDAEIAELQEKILGQLSAQLDKGVITSNDYVDQLNAKTEAELNQQMHLMQIAQIKVQLLSLKGLL